MDDELPPYTRHDSLASSYLWIESASSFTYTLRQTMSKVQELLPFASAPHGPYRIKHLRGAGLSSSKPDFVVSRKQTGPKEKDEIRANIRFARALSFPWVPRAHIMYSGLDRPSYTQEVVLSNLRAMEWRMDIDSVPHQWRVMAQPASLALVNQHTSMTLAKFVYSERGTYAREGQEVGRFEIFSPVGRDLTVDLFEQIVCGAIIVISYAKDMGRARKLANPAVPDYEA